MDAIEHYDLTLPWANALRAGIYRPEQYLGVWAIHQTHVTALADAVSSMGWESHVDAAQAAASGVDLSYEVADRVAVIEVAGTITKYGSSLGGAPSALELRRQLRSASRDKAVDAILLRIDSPGGTVSGTQDLAEEVAAVNKRKPVIAYIEDMGASAAYWIASQASRVLANPTAEVGSIGTYGVLYDYSSMYAAAGIKAYVISTGEHKGAGVEGTEVTPEQRGELQKIVNELNEFFVAAVAKGRAMDAEAVRGLADGRVWLAKEAKKLGLLDGVTSLDAALAAARRTARNTKEREVATMAGEDRNDVAVVEEAKPQVAEPKAASLAELKEFCAGADAEFLLSQIEVGATAVQALKAWNIEQSKRLAKAQEEAEQAKAEAKKPGYALSGDSTPDASAEQSDPVAEFERRLNEKLQSGMSRNSALLALNREDPDLREAYVEAYNETHRDWLDRKGPSRKGGRR